MSEEYLLTLLEEDEEELLLTLLEDEEDGSQSEN